RRQCSPSHAAHPRWLERGEGPICFVGALDSRLNVQQVRLAGCLRAPPRSWTLLVALAGFVRQALRATTRRRPSRASDRRGAPVYEQDLARDVFGAGCEEADGGRDVGRLAVAAHRSAVGETL